MSIIRGFSQTSGLRRLLLLSYSLLFISSCRLTPSKQAASDAGKNGDGVSAVGLDPKIPHLLNEREYRASIQDAFSTSLNFFGSRVIDDTGGFDNLSDNQVINEASVNFFLTEASSIVDQLREKGFGLDCNIEYNTEQEKDRINNQKSNSEKDADKCANKWLNVFQARLYRRPIKEDERKSIEKYFTRIKLAQRVLSWMPLQKL